MGHKGEVVSNETRSPRGGECGPRFLGSAANRVIRQSLGVEPAVHLKCLRLGNPSVDLGGDISEGVFVLFGGSLSVLVRLVSTHRPVVGHQPTPE